MQVKPEEFHPKPKVDSAIVRLSFQQSPERIQKIGPIDYPLLKTVVTGAFGQRRKTLLNALSATGLLDKHDIAECIAATGLAPLVRAERLELENFVQLSRAIAERRDSQ